MRWASTLRQRFGDLDPHVDDLFLLEAHQVAALPERAPSRELAVVLHAHPDLHRYFVARNPGIAGFLSTTMAEHEPAPDDLAACEESLVWELADWIVYERDPARYDEHCEFDTGLSAITDVVDLDDRVVIDAGAGTGRMTLAVAPIAGHVFAVEPVAALRGYLRDRARHLGIDGVYVLDGCLDDVPLPPGTADVLLTRQAIGWHLADELTEIERVVVPGGTALHLVGTPFPAPDGDEMHRALVEAGYEAGSYVEAGVTKRRYWKRIGA